MEIILVFAGIALSTPPEQLADKDRIAALIRQLDDDEFRTRDRATRGLRQIGFATVGLLETASKTGSTEIRERSERLAREIRRASYRPGKQAEGMVATLRTEREVFAANEPITMHFEIKNASNISLGIPSTVQWSYSQTYGPELYRVRGLYVPSHASIEVHQLSGRKPVKNMSPIACGGLGSTPAFTAVRSGNAIDFIVPVTMVDRFTPGEYEVTVTFYTYHVVKGLKVSTQLIDGMMGTPPHLANREPVTEPSLTSNKVRIVVE